MITEQEKQIISTLILQFCQDELHLKLTIDCEYLFKFIDVNDRPSFAFHFNGSDCADYCCISYHYGRDSYIMEFQKTTELVKHNRVGYVKKREIVKTFNDVYCDELTSLFEDFTGLNLNYKPIFG